LTTAKKASYYTIVKYQIQPEVVRFQPNEFPCRADDIRYELITEYLWYNHSQEKWDGYRE
jgi:hypothetical protein